MNAMKLAIKRYVTTLVIIILTILAGVQFVNGQPQQRSDTPGKSVALAPPSDLTSEIATMLRAYYDGWTKLDAATVSAAVADDGFVTVDGRVLTGSVFKSSVRADFIATAPNDNYQFEIEELCVFQSSPDSAVANYRLISTPTDKNLAKTTENITDSLVRRDGRWLIFAESTSNIPRKAEPIISGLPLNWQRSGKADLYSMVVDSEIRHSGNASASIKFNCGDDQFPWGSLGQPIAADDYRSKRVRLSGWLRTLDAGQASLWMRVDGERRQLAFDAMSGRSAGGTTQWKMYSVVLDVPNEAKNIFLGAVLVGKGQMWADDLTLEVVDKDVSVTKPDSGETPENDSYAKIPKATNKRPVNMSFEEGRIP